MHVTFVISKNLSSDENPQLHHQSQLKSKPPTSPKTNSWQSLIRLSSIQFSPAQLVHFLSSIARASKRRKFPSIISKSTLILVESLPRIIMNIIIIITPQINWPNERRSAIIVEVFLQTSVLHVEQSSQWRASFSH